jgi:CRISPR system Cascade subunit CasE
MTHHFVSLVVKVPALLRHLSEVKAHALARADEGTLIKTAFAESFGAGRWPKPFAVRQRGLDGSYEILAYTKHSPEELASIYSPVPSLAAAVPLSSIRGYPLTAPRSGTELRFHITFCPMVRTYSDSGNGLHQGIRGRERDSYTIETERASADGRKPLDRMMVYREFLDKRMAGADIVLAHPTGFGLDRIQRGKGRHVHRFAVPSVTFSGVLRVADPEIFLETVTSGIGRQRTYGYGMILLGASAPRVSSSA